MFKQAEVRKIAKHAFTDAVQFLSLIDILDGANANGASEALNKAGAGRAAVYVQRALFSTLHILVARHYLPVREKDDLHAAKAFELMKNPDVRAGVVSQDDRLGAAEAKWKACCEDQRLAGYIRVRHKQLAHLAEIPEGFNLPNYKDVLEIAKNTAACFNDLANGVGIVTVEIETQIVPLHNSTTAFWKHWTA